MIRALAVAIALSLPLWAVIGFAAYAIARLAGIVE